MIVPPAHTYATTQVGADNCPPRSTEAAHMTDTYKQTVLNFHALSCYVPNDNISTHVNESLRSIE